MRSRPIWITCAFALIARAGTVVPPVSHGQAADSPKVDRTLLAVFAHPDDETIVGPLLARYARQPGTSVYLVIATNGEKGVTPFANIPGGDQLAAVRTKEAECAARVLGTRPPLLLGLPDGGLSAFPVLVQLASRLQAVFNEVRPDAIVTWGPDGGYGHPDHRLVSAVVTQLVQAGSTTRLMYYAGLPKSRLESDTVKELRFPAPFTPVMDDLLTVRVAYSTDDQARAKQALGCHKSQFTSATMELLHSLTEHVHVGRMHLRLWSGGAPRTDLFER